jgi:poly-gamma-glutamate synthesis protein (capsule biosynthesis protein)
MSGLLYRYTVLLAAVAMTGVTAFTVTPLPDAPAKIGLSSQTSAPAAISNSFTAIRTPFVPGVARPNIQLADRREFVMATRVVEPAVKTAIVAFGGDILVHNGVRNSASVGATGFDFKPMFAEIKPLLSAADLAICHLEVPLTSSNTDLSSYPKFNAPRELAEGIADAGFDGCSTASNHSMDKGEGGLVDTLDILDAVGLKHAGTARSPEEAASATMYELDNLTVAHIAGTYWLNGLSTPSEKEWMAQRLDTKAMLDMAGRARWAGADLVVVSVHCCTEYLTNPTDAQVDVFEELITSPWVDLVVGHHSHVVGPVGMVDDEYVVYGLGNLLSGQLHTVATSEAFIAVANAEWADGRWRFVDVDAVPTVVERGTYHVVLAERDGGSFSRTMNTLSSFGIEVDFYGIAPAPD